MVKNKIILPLLLLLISVHALPAQVNRYMIFFTDKHGSEYSIDRPEEFLSARAINRRERFNVSITAQDLPINVNYVNTVELMDIDVFFKTRWFNGILVQMDQSKVEEVKSLSFVRTVELVAPGAKLNVTPQVENIFQPGLNARTSMVTNAQQNNMLGVDQMHKDGYTGEGILVGVFDAGFNGMNKSIYFSHVFENNKIVAVRDFVENSGDVFQYDDHGTGVVSTISAYEDTVYNGIAYNVDLVLCVTEDTQPEHKIEEYNWLFAAEFADSLGVDIINTSLGYNTFDDPGMNYEYGDMDGNTAIITIAADIAASKGILCIVSVGNEGNNANWEKLVAPADADSVMAVGAVNANFDYVSFSSPGPTADGRIKPDVSALGISTKIVQYDGELTNGNGTSYASPLIAGLAAGLWEAYPELTNVELIELIRKGSTQYLEPDTLIGYGIPDYNKIMSVITAFEEEIDQDIYKVYPNPVDNKKLFIEFNDQSLKERIEIKIHNINGLEVFKLSLTGSEMNKKLELDLNGLDTGVYLLELRSRDLADSVKILIP